MRQPCLFLELFLDLIARHHAGELLAVELVLPFRNDDRRNAVANQVGERASDMKRSIPRINASPATGIVGTLDSVAASTMNPLPVKYRYKGFFVFGFPECS